MLALEASLTRLDCPRIRVSGSERHLGATPASTEACSELRDRDWWRTEAQPV